MGHFWRALKLQEPAPPAWRKVEVSIECDAAAPGANSLGTALSSDTVGNGRPMKGPLLGTDPAIDREEAKVNRMMNSICRGC